MTPRYARFGGWLLLSGVVGLVVACSTPTVDGTEVDNSQGASSKRDKRGTEKSTKSTKTDDRETEEDETPATETTSVPTSSATTTTAPTSTATTAPTGTTTPVVTHPACGNADPIACLECCLDANPSATAFEDEYDSCMDGCRGDTDCFDNCQSQHVSRCAANTSCKTHHACMEANNCLQQNFCNPL